MIESGKIIKMLDENGNSMDCEILCVYLCEENGKNYALYTDNKYDSDGALNLYASVYVGEDEDGNPKFEEIEDENEWALLDKVMEEVSTGGEE